MTQVLVFQSITFEVVDRNGQPWIKASQLAQALGYAREDKITRLYQRNADEFTVSMTQLIEICEEPHFGTKGRFRIFSLRGCHLIAMLARTKVAKDFRVWVLDVLESLGGAEQPAIPSTTTPSTAADRKPLRSLVNAWAQVSGVHHSALWPQVKAHFQLERIDDLPVEWLPDALAFVQERIAEAQRPPQPALPEAPQSQPDPLSEHYIRLYADELRGAMAHARNIQHRLWQAVAAHTKNIQLRQGIHDSPRNSLLCALHNTCAASFDAWAHEAGAIEQSVKAMRILAVDMR